MADPDALDAMVERDEQVRVQFTYAGYEVAVDDDGRVTVSEPELE